MTISLSTRTTLVALTLATLQLVGCSSTPKDEFAGMTAEKLYAEAKSDAESGAYERAIKGLERVEGLAAGTLLAQQAQLDMAHLQWKSGDKAQASTTVERFIKLNPSSPGLPYAMYLRGLVNFNDDLGFLGVISGQDLSERDQRAARDAWQAFKQLIEQFPNSPYAADAKLRMDYIVGTLAQYEVHVARYYLRRGAYVAAANRAQATVEEFQQSPAVEEALYILVQAYDKLELTTLKTAAERVLRQNFPNSAFLTQGLAARQRPWWQLW
jgi:outer membrane protein assembly factor BamD